MICSQNDVKFYENFRLTNFNTLKIKADAKLFILPDNDGEFVGTIKKYSKQNPVILGNGSNILFSSGGIERTVIYSGNLDRISLSGSKLEVQAGVKVQTLSKYAYEHSFYGFEFLIGIPATLGGAVYMNAGAHNQTISDNLITAKVYDYENLKTINLSKEDLDFSYRHSVLSQKPYALINATFELSKGDKNEIKSKMDENIIFRKNRQPNLALPNAGSVFKNPPNCEYSAGALIDMAGFRGYSIGDCEVWQNHCNFIVNKGNATSFDYTNLVYEIYCKVQEKFNIKLKPEIVYISNDTIEGSEKLKEEKEKWKIMKN